MGFESTVTVKAPVRVDIAGGTLDVYPVYTILGSSLTINFAIDIITRVKIKKREVEGILIHHPKDMKREFVSSHALEDQGGLALVKHVFDYFPALTKCSLTFESEAPQGSGLGASSSLIIALLTAIGLYSNNPIPVTNLLQVASEIESSLIKMVTGKQDYVAAIFGGLNIIRFSPGKTQMVNLKKEKAECRWLEEVGFLAFTGISHVSAKENWLFVRKLIDGGKMGRAKFDQLLSLAEEASAAISRRDPEMLADIMDREWVIRKSLSPKVTVEHFERFLKKREVKNVISSARLCGAGGGGTMFALLKRRDVRSKLELLAKRAGFLPIRYSIAQEMEVWVDGKKIKLL